MKTLFAYLNAQNWGLGVALLALGGAPVVNLVVFAVSGLVWGVRAIPAYWSVVSTINGVFQSVYVYLFS